jgi:hypothetical protein
MIKKIEAITNLINPAIIGGMNCTTTDVATKDIPHNTTVMDRNIKPFVLFCI